MPFGCKMFWQTTCSKCSKLQTNKNWEIYEGSLDVVFVFLLLLTLNWQHSHVYLQASSITVDVFKALCTLLCCWNCCWIYTEATCPKLGFQITQENQRWMIAAGSLCINLLNISSPIDKWFCNNSFLLSKECNFEKLSAGKVSFFLELCIMLDDISTYMTNNCIYIFLSYDHYTDIIIFVYR